MTTVSKAKEVNYTPEQTAQLLAGYAQRLDAGEAVKQAVEALSVQFGKTTRSIVAKLSREGVYSKQGYVTKTGEAVFSKEAMVSEIARVIGCDITFLDGLDKANKETLRVLLAGLSEVGAMLSTSTKPEIKGDD
jgi:hypothetical protein